VVIVDPMQRFGVAYSRNKISILYATCTVKRFFYLCYMYAFSGRTMSYISSFAAVIDIFKVLPFSSENAIKWFKMNILLKHFSLNRSVDLQGKRLERVRR
jgi:hypothetical protein